MTKGFRQPQQEPPSRAFYAINLSIIKPAGEEYLSSLSGRLEQALQDGLSTNAVLTPLVATGAAYGPFEDKRGALMMAASDLNESDEDHFGVKWGVIETKMTESDFQRPLINDVRIFVCTDDECKGTQRFKGACAKCKSEGRPLIRTVEVRDWEGKLNAN